MTDDEIIEALRARVADGRPTDTRRVIQVPQPVSEDVVNAAEVIIGWPLPPLARRIYQEVANGGVGPFSGIEGLSGGHSSNGDGMLDDYEQYLRYPREPDEPPVLPRGVLFFCDFGCAMWALLDCRHPMGQMWWWESGNRDKLSLTLAEWFRSWLAGNSYDVWARQHLRLDDESWHHGDADPEFPRIRLHPDQATLW